MSRAARQTARGRRGRRLGINAHKLKSVAIADRVHAGAAPAFPRGVETPKAKRHRRGRLQRPGCGAMLQCHQQHSATARRGRKWAHAPDFGVPVERPTAHLLEG